jgi:NAD(P)-dependent dehydrogenase (short-subunit alcohol dehydrogenase family)
MTSRIAKSLSSQCVLITGPARGIGAETARQLAARGARLALVGLEPERLASLARDLGPRHVWFEADVTDQPALDAAVAGTIAALGSLDAVVANAGIASNGTVAAAPVEALARTVEVNLIGLIRSVSATLPHIIASRGYYLLVSSASAFAPVPGIAAYGASKVGVEHFGSSLRLEVAHRGVDVGVAHPSWVDTDLVRDPQNDLGTFNEMLRTLPGAFGTITPVADCAAAFVDALEHRRRVVYVPRSLRPLAALRQLFASRVVDVVSARRARDFMPRLEGEVSRLGRAFGASSVESSTPKDERR